MTRRPSPTGIATVIAVLIFAPLAGLPAPRSASQPAGSAETAAPSPTGPTAGGVAATRTGAPAAQHARPSDQRPSSGVDGAPTPSVGVAQSEEHRSVKPEVVGSKPTAHPTPRPTSRPTALPRVTAGRTVRPSPVHAGSITGTASWYCLSGRSACTRGYDPGCTCAAAGPSLRAALGDWRGAVVTVATRRASVRVRLVDWCSCPNGRVLDLFAYPFSGLAPLSAGLVDVEVSW